MEETRKSWEKQQETKRNKKKEEEKNVHLPKMQQNTIQIFQLMYTIHSFVTPYCDKNIIIEILR